MSRRAVLYVKSPRQWKVLISPARSEILQALRCIGPCSVAELAAMIDRPADALYRHLDLLQTAGFVTRTGERKRARHTEQLLDVTADDFAIDFPDIAGVDEHRTVVETARAFLRASARAVRDAAADGQLTINPEADRNFVLNYELAWLTPEKFQEARHLVHRLKRLMEEGNAQRAGRLYVSLTLAVPLTRRRGGATSTGGKRSGSKAVRRGVRKPGRGSPRGS